MAATLPLAALLGAALLNTVPGSFSAAAPIAEDDAVAMAKIVTSAIADKLPPAASTLLVTPRARLAAKEKFSSVLIAELRAAGFGLASDRKLSPDAHVVRYELSPAWDGVMLRLQIDNVEASRLYLHNNQGDLAPAGPLSLREVE